jgi:phosphate transport system permease protein
VTTNEDQGKFVPRQKRRKLVGRFASAMFFGATAVGIIALLILLIDVWNDGAAYLSRDFLTSFPSRIAARAGIMVPLWGSLWILGFTALFSIPLGVATAIWLEEYAPPNRWTRTIQMNIANLAAVPSIVYGILGLAVFVRAMSLGRSVLSGALTLTLLILPVIIIAAQEALRAVPNSIRLGAYALGATRWQTISRQVLPIAFPGVMTGVILALSRAVGETAPLIIIGALAYVPFIPSRPGDQFTVLPIQIFDWISRPQVAFHHLAAAAIMVLLVVLLAFNLIAVLLRNKFTKTL